MFHVLPVLTTEFNGHRPSAEGDTEIVQEVGKDENVSHKSGFHNLFHFGKFRKEDGEKSSSKHAIADVPQRVLMSRLRPANSQYDGVVISSVEFLDEPKTHSPTNISAQPVPALRELSFERILRVSFGTITLQ